MFLCRASSDRRSDHNPHTNLGENKILRASTVRSQRVLCRAQNQLSPSSIWNLPEKSLELAMC